MIDTNLDQVLPVTPGKGLLFSGGSIDSPFRDFPRERPPRKEKTETGTRTRGVMLSPTGEGDLDVEHTDGWIIG